MPPDDGPAGGHPDGGAEHDVAQKVPVARSAEAAPTPRMTHVDVRRGNAAKSEPVVLTNARNPVEGGVGCCSVLFGICSRSTLAYPVSAGGAVPTRSAGANSPVVRSSPSADAGARDHQRHSQNHSSLR
jgi:hypothetical protein